MATYCVKITNSFFSGINLKRETSKRIDLVITIIFNVLYTIKYLVFTINE